jgi:hypothetical protein
MLKLVVIRWKVPLALAGLSVDDLVVPLLLASDRCFSSRFNSQRGRVCSISLLVGDQCVPV